MELTHMTMLETKKEIETAIANGGNISLDALLNAYLAVQTYINLYGSHDIKMTWEVKE
jgi:hypothetical protein